MDTVRLLSISVTPVVLISACGLIMLALYNRLNAILVRIRAFHQQKITLLEDVGKRETDDQRQRLLDMIDSQISKVTAKAKAIQRGLYCLLSAVMAFLMCSLLTPAVLLHERVGIAALAMHVIGLLLFLAGIACAIRELKLSLIPLEEENAYLGVFTAQRQNPFHDAPRSRTAKSA
jgi:hypothetical protein